MNLAVLLNCIGIWLGAVAGLFFIQGASDLKAADIAKLSAGAFDDNPGFRKYLISTKADYLCGGYAFLAAFCLQVFGNTPIPHFSEIPVFAKGETGALCSCFIAALAFTTLKVWRNRIVKSLTLELEPS